MQKASIPLHLKPAVTAKQMGRNQDARADHVALMTQLNPLGFRQPKTGRHMIAQGGNYMSLAEKTSVDAGMMDEYKPTTKEVRASRKKPRFDSKLRLRDPEKYQQVRAAERKLLKTPLSERRANRAARRKTARLARKQEIRDAA